MLLRVATYNIHRWAGRDGVGAPKRIAKVLKGINADVTALQEVGYEAGGSQNTLADMGRTTQTRTLAGPTLIEGRSRYGNAVLTRFSPRKVDRWDLSVPGREPRGAIALVLTINTRSVQVVATHLGLGPAERRQQMQRLRTLMDKLPTTDVTILMGDFNEWFRWARPLRWVRRQFGRQPAPATFPSRQPLLALDRIWVKPADHLKVLRTYRQSPAPAASDHLPLVAHVRI
jgi:endonuclease/exonuclease/phosphatase family metal-dependent hydrolase